MIRNKSFIFRVNQEERNLIYELAQHLQRTQSDAVRLIITNAARAIATNSSPLNFLDPSTQLFKDEDIYYDS